MDTIRDFKSTFYSTLEKRGIPEPIAVGFPRIFSEINDFIAKPVPNWERPDLERFLKLRAGEIRPDVLNKYLLALGVLTELLEERAPQKRPNRLQTKPQGLESIDTHQFSSIRETGQSPPPDDTDFLAETLARTQDVVYKNHGFDRADHTSKWKTRPRSLKQRRSGKFPKVGVEWDNSLHFVHVRWCGLMHSSQLHRVLERGMEIQNRFKGHHWIFDINEALIPNPEDVSWFSDWLADAEALGIRCFAIVGPDELITELQLDRLRMGTQNWRSKDSTELCFFDTFAQAQSWLKREVELY